MDRLRKILKWLDSPQQYRQAKINKAYWEGHREGRALERKLMRTHLDNREPTC